ncbi:hypothetical protein EV175_001628 [Coemansia sp. RSA 1933]|nr:hypothetical protein EV175_001628 [Coemansia sp. RSA 1933]
MKRMTSDDPDSVAVLGIASAQHEQSFGLYKKYWATDRSIPCHEGHDLPGDCLAYVSVCSVQGKNDLCLDPDVRIAAKSVAIYMSDLTSSKNNATNANEHLLVQPNVLLNDFIKLSSASSGAKDAHWYRNMTLEAPVDWTFPSDCPN